MMERILNNRIVRIIVGLVIGVPLTALAFVAGVHGLLIGYGGIVKGEPLWIIIGVITVVGFIGISGAWRRILKSSISMTGKERQVVRAMLFCGVASSLSLTVWSYFIEKTLVVPLILVVLALGGFVFILATPKLL